MARQGGIALNTNVIHDGYCKVLRGDCLAITSGSCTQHILKGSGIKVATCFLGKMGDVSPPPCTSLLR